MNADNESRYALAIENYNRAKELWKEEEGKNELSPQLELFFEFTIGGVYQSSGRDDYAFNSFYNCRNFIEKIPYLNPDRALPYCGLGEVLYNVE